MRRSGLVSAILTTVACVNGLFWSILLVGADRITLPPVEAEGAGAIGMIFVLIYGGFLAFLVAVPLVGAHLHGLCLVFNIRGYRAPRLGIRVWHIVLSALNSTVILLFLARLILWRINGMVA